jgi:hypothetical protein
MQAQFLHWLSCSIFLLACMFLHLLPVLPKGSPTSGTASDLCRAKRRSMVSFHACLFFLLVPSQGDGAAWLLNCCNLCITLRQPMNVCVWHASLFISIDEAY